MTLKKYQTAKEEELVLEYGIEKVFEVLTSVTTSQLLQGKEYMSVASVLAHVLAVLESQVPTSINYIAKASHQVFEHLKTNTGTTTVNEKGTA